MKNKLCDVKLYQVSKKACYDLFMPKEPPMKNICPNCKKETEVSLVQVIQNTEVRGEQIPVKFECFKCSACNTDFDAPKSGQKPLEMVYREYRKRHGMLQPEEIKSLRKKYGLTQYEMANLLGWGVATLNRYENGALQDDAHERVLHLIADHRNFLKVLEENPNTIAPEKREKLVHQFRTIIGKETDWLEQIFKNYFGDYPANELSGFRTLDLLKFFHAILFFCQEGISKTKLNKLLFYADFEHFKEYGISITGSRYARITFGPVPDQYEHYYAMLRSKEWLKIEENFYTDMVEGKDVIWEKLVSNQKPDLSIFSTTELKILASIKEYFSDFTAKKIVDFSHEEQCYKETENGQLISYNYADRKSVV